MYLTTKGVVLRVSVYNDTDALLTILTHEHGKLTVQARGLRRKNSPLIAPCQLLAYSDFVLFEYRGMYTINEATSIELFHPLRRDIQKLSLATYFAQVAEVICQEDIPNPELLSLMLNCTFALSQLNVAEKLVKAAFELRIMCIAGYMPDLSGCGACGNDDPSYFDLSQGQLLCIQCRNTASVGIKMPVTAGTVAAMRYICCCEPKKIFAFQAGEQSLELLANLAEGYLTTQLERGFSTLDFYKTLILPI